MIVLGLIDSKPSSAAILVDGTVVSAVSEERLCRWKMATGMPREAIPMAMQVAGVTAQDIDLVSVAQNALHWEPNPQPWPGWFQASDNGGSQSKKGLFYQVSSALAPAVGSLPIAWKAHHTLKGFMNRDRREKLPELLRDAYGITAPVKFYDHHYCHAVPAYYSSNFNDALVVTLDGGGDGRSGSVYVGENGRLRPVASVDSYNSIGNFYSYITALCGFKAELHEGKITGLAALGEPIYLDILREFIRYEHPGSIRYTIPMYHRSALRRIRERLPENFDKAGLAASVQELLEEIGIKFIQHWLQQTGKRNIAVAGGVFANVKFNQRVHELDEVDNFFVYPPMGDEGLAAGGALAAYADQPGVDPASLIHHLPNVYLGMEYTPDEIEAAIEAAGAADNAAQPENLHQKIAELLADGAVVARFTGRMEYGPRALGHRTVLYQTTDPSVNDWMNDNLKRTEFMPFAPATLIEHAHDCYNNLEGAMDPARFMTITFDCTPLMGQQSPGVVHVDNTARPQLVDPDTAPDFYGILTEYHKITGIPSLINTSFNMHGEPIVGSPEDALRSFQQGNLDYLAIGDWLVAHPEADQMLADRKAMLAVE